MNSRSSKGFTLLEVMVALTITGLALGGLFGVIAGSKRLAWRAEQSLVHSSQVRSLINFSQLVDEHGEVFVSWENDDLELVTGGELEMPERKTQATNEELRSYEITDENGEVIAQGTYWMFPEFPEVPPGAAGAGAQELDPELAPIGAPSIRNSRNPSPRITRDPDDPALGIRGFGDPPPPPGPPRNDPDSGPVLQRRPQ